MSSIDLFSRYCRTIWAAWNISVKYSKTSLEAFISSEKSGNRSTIDHYETLPIAKKLGREFTLISYPLADNVCRFNRMSMRKALWDTKDAILHIQPDIHIVQRCSPRRAYSGRADNGCAIAEYPSQDAEYAKLQIVIWVSREMFPVPTRYDLHIAASVRTSCFNIFSQKPSDCACEDPWISATKRKAKRRYEYVTFYMVKSGWQ
jgi:hypothetical protein